MINLNPRYAMIDYNIGLVKKFIKELDYIALLDLCPRIIIPKSSLFYHSTKLNYNDIENYTLSIQNNLYPKNNQCQTCEFVDEVPYENIGDKPRIMELTVNPNQKQNKSCVCQTGRQERLYGNFNFSGNYDIALGKTILKGTEILLSTEDIILIDLNYLSIELGFSPKRFFYNDEETLNGFGAQRNWTSYCIKNKIDGLVMVDIIDEHPIDLTHKTNLSCYHYINPHGEKGKIVCPEFVLVAKLGLKSKQLIGTDKLKILGVVNLFDNGTKINRDQAEQLFQLFFTKLSRNLYPINLNIVFDKNITLFKSLSIEYQGTDMDPSFLFDQIQYYIHLHGNQDFYLSYNNIESEDKIYIADLDYLEHYNKVNLELDVPTLPDDIELYTDIIIKNIIPRNTNYYFKNGKIVDKYVTDPLFDIMLNYIADQLNINSTLFVNYNKLSFIKSFNQYTLDYFMDYVKENHIKTFIDQLELNIVANFYVNCYVKYNQLTMNNDALIFVEALIEAIMIMDINLKQFRNKTWENFKTSYLEQPEKYICHLNDYTKIMNKVVTDDNFMIQYIYYLLEDNLTISLDDLLLLIEDYTTDEQAKFNLEWFTYYTNYLKNNNGLLTTFNEFINRLTQMTT